MTPNFPLAHELMKQFRPSCVPVNVTKLEDFPFVPEKCLTTSLNVEKKFGHKVVAGFIVYAYEEDDAWTSINPHYFNVTTSGEYLDASYNGGFYFYDDQLFEYARQLNMTLKINVMYDEDTWVAIPASEKLNVITNGRADKAMIIDHLPVGLNDLFVMSQKLNVERSFITS